MKKSTKNLVFFIFVLVIFLGSSIAFVATGIYGNNPQQETLEPLKSFVINGEIDQRLETAYLQNGYTFLKYFYYQQEDPIFEGYLDSLPDTTKTNFDQKQLFVQKISSDDNRIIIRGPGGETLITGANMTQMNIFQTLCNTLAVTPPECALNITT